MRYPRIMIAATASGQGKTTLTCGLLAVIKRRHKKAASFKCGPDYIDPMFHEQVLHTPSKNLDPYFTDPAKTRELFVEDAKAADISILEGVMGYYDGIAGTTTKASSYKLACVTKTPVILVVDAKGSSVSLCAVIKGFLEYRKDTRIQGVILNRISKGLYDRMKGFIEAECGVLVVGYLPYTPQISIPSRHLGLTTPEELSQLEEQLNHLGNICQETLDIDAILNIAEGAEEIYEWECTNKEHPDSQEEFSPDSINIGVARDEAFSFYYKDNLTLLQKMGAKLQYFSPIYDVQLPKGIQGLLLGGGYPEEYGSALEENVSMRHSVKEALDAGMPCIAECGGYVYLHETLTDRTGKQYVMTGFLSGNCYMTEQRSRFGYIQLENLKDQLTGPAGTKIKGHEFHYMESTRTQSSEHACIARKPESHRSWECVYGTDHIYAGFPHLYYESNPQIVKEFLRKGHQYGTTL